MKENTFLAWIAAHTPPHRSVPLHVGDDMAIVNLHPEMAPAPAGASPLLTSSTALLKIDQALDQVHFDLRQHRPAQAGRKAVNRCLSDCAAMACLPAAILISVALPAAADEAFAQELFLGCRDAAARFDCPLVGGDTSIWDQRLAITVAALGKPAPEVTPVTRSGGRPGDAIFVTGRLGGSILGRHLDFLPRIELAVQLAGRVKITAMMDLSDGLAQDLPRLCQASSSQGAGRPIGAVIAPAYLPVHPDAERLAAQDGLPAGLHALADGEDYELLFTVAEADLPRLFSDPRQGQPFDVPLTRIGTLTDTGELHLIDEQEQLHPWPRMGWEHHS